MRSEQEPSLELEVTGAAPCTENFFSLLHLFPSQWQTNVLALQCSYVARALQKLSPTPDAKKAS